MNCRHCKSHIRTSDIESSLFNVIESEVIGTVLCHSCGNYSIVKQVKTIEYISIEVDRRVPETKKINTAYKIK